MRIRLKVKCRDLPLTISQSPILDAKSLLRYNERAGTPLDGNNPRSTVSGINRMAHAFEALSLSTRSYRIVQKRIVRHSYQDSILLSSNSMTLETGHSTILQWSAGKFQNSDRTYCNDLFLLQQCHPMILGVMISSNRLLGSFKCHWHRAWVVPPNTDSPRRWGTTSATATADIRMWGTLYPYGQSRRRATDNGQ